ncbi:ROK family protein [Oceanivirga salmonicida]|uniref:ROK family protein n=1 Tax=Oceanivirga salmonicida TaxID=1769291 RepID=UPI0012E2CFDA|nr:ROK family protein [Oceanivirga salmonicida]
MRIIAGIEAGGTKINCGIGYENGEIIDRISIPTTTPEKTINEIIRYFKDKDFTSMGLASFGPIDIDKNSSTYGYITTTPKPGWANTNILGEIKKHFNVPINFDSDVNAAVLAEKTWGSAIGLNNALYLTIGTGIGGGAIINNRIHKGLTLPEMGHIFVKKEIDFKGICPYHGDCLEGLASGPAIEKRTGIKGNLILEDNPVWNEVANHLAEAIVSYILILSPEKIILGGGVMKQKHLFTKIQKKVLEKLNGYVDNKKITENIQDYIVFPKLGDFTGFYGSLALALIDNN